MGQIVRTLNIPTDDQKAALDAATTQPTALNPFVTAADIPGAGPVTSIAFDTTPTVPAHAEGQLYWDESDKTLAIDMGHPGVTLQVGQEQFVRVFNNTGAPITDGSVVYISGASGNRPTVNLADASVEAMQYVLGVVTHTLDATGDGRYGYCTVHGIVRTFNTSTFTAGVPIWLSETAGEMTQTRPPAPAHAVYIGIPLNSTANGSIFVNPKAGNEIGELHDVLITSAANEDIISYDTAAAYWKNKPFPGDHLHGIEASGTLAFDNTTHVVTLGAGTNTYWFRGTKYTTAGAITCDLDLAEDRDHASATLTASTMYYIYFKDATGKLYWSPTVWSLESYVPVCTVYWTGAAGVVTNERHGHRRDIEWHKWAHLTVGARISAADFAQTFPASAAPWVFSTHVNAGGTLWDEDIGNAIAAQTASAFRVWYETAAGVWAFTDNAYPYITAVSYVDTNNSYNFTALGVNEYINCWVYASPDITQRLYCFIESATDPYGTIGSARAVAPPNLSSFKGTPELKLLYRLIFRGNENFYEATDYRSSSSLPAGGVSSSPSATAVTTIAGTAPYNQTNVQSYLEALVTNKQDSGALPLSGGTMTGNVTLGENTSIALNPAGSADGKYSGITVTGIGGDTISFGDLVTLDKDDSRWEKVDISVAAGVTGDARGVIGMAVTSSTDGGAITVLLNGIIRADAKFPALTIGAPVYAETTGGVKGTVVVAQPSTADYVIRIIGFALTADELYLNPSNDYITHV